jgi:hypothetical protein
MDRRYVCTGCGVKWFVPAARPQAHALTTCGACGGALAPLEAQSDQPPKPVDETD